MQHVKSHLIALTIRFYCLILKLTCRIEIQNRDSIDEFWNNGRAVMLPVWHGRLIFMTLIKYRFPITTMISAHKDGRLVAAYVKQRGANVIDGSTSTGAIKAMKAMIDAGKKGHSLITTPDGPRGPIYELSRGTLEMGRLSGLSIIPICGTGTKVKVLRSWDQFMIPLPFSKITIHFGEPHTCPYKTDKEQRQAKADILESAMCKQREWLDENYGPPPA